MLNNAIHHLDAWIGRSAGTIDNIAVLNEKMAATISQYQAVAGLWFEVMLSIFPNKSGKFIAGMGVAME